MIALPARWAPYAAADRQHAAAAVLFEKVHRAWAYCDDHGGIDKKALLDSAVLKWSDGELILVKSALDLFDPGCVSRAGYRPAHAGEIARVLDDGFYAAYLEALAIARGTGLGARGR